LGNADRAASSIFAPTLRKPIARGILRRPGEPELDAGSAIATRIMLAWMIDSIGQAIGAELVRVARKRAFELF
jgi:hypothetical protein